MNNFCAAESYLLALVINMTAFFFHFASFFIGEYKYERDPVHLCINIAMNHVLCTRNYFILSYAGKMLQRIELHKESGFLCRKFLWILSSSHKNNPGSISCPRVYFPV